MKSVVRQEGVEPSTCGLEDRCSIQLSYCHTKNQLHYYDVAARRGKQIISANLYRAAMGGAFRGRSARLYRVVDRGGGYAVG
jgi:hypothetical protein